MRYGGYGMTDGLLDVDLDTYIRTCHMTHWQWQKTSLKLLFNTLLLLVLV